MRYIEGQIIEAHARVLAKHAEIVSGAYRLRKTQAGDPENATRWRDCTDEEKLANAQGEMRNHMEWLGKLIEALATPNERAGIDD